LIERALAALASGCLDPDLRRKAERAAHMLAGSVGMFGFVSASDAAHDLESGLTHAAPDRAPELSALLLAVREGVRGPVVLCSEASTKAPAHESPVEETPATGTRSSATPPPGRGGETPTTRRASP